MHARSLLGAALFATIGLIDLSSAQAQMSQHGNAYFVTGDVTLSTRFYNREFIIGKDDPYSFTTVTTPATVTFDQYAATTSYGSVFPSSPGYRYNGLYVFGSHRVVGKDGVNLQRLTARDGSTISMSGTSSNSYAELRESSTINFEDDATAGTIYAYDNATVNYEATGGGRFQAEGNSTVNIGSGNFSNYHFFNGTSTVNIAGGLFNYGNGGSYPNGLYAGENSVMNISGGTFEGTITGTGDSRINMRGGAYGSYSTIYLRQNASMNFYGTNMSFELVNTWQYGKIYRVMGEWDDGVASPFSMLVYDQDSYDGTGNVNTERQFALVVVPEAGTGTLIAAPLALGALGAVRRRAKGNAAPRL